MDHFLGNPCEVVLLFRGMFRDAGFARMLTAAFDWSGRRALEVVTVIADAQFDFPSVDVYDKEVPCYALLCLGSWFGVNCCEPKVLKDRKEKHAGCESLICQGVFVF